jgi:hypothetical protein
LIKNDFLQRCNDGALIVDGLEEGMEDEKIYRKLAKHLDNLPGASLPPRAAWNCAS